MSTISNFPTPPTQRSLAVIVADDTLEVQLLIRRWLEELGHTVYCVSSGSAAVQLIRQQPVDLVITEVIMPNGDGLEVILELKRRQPSARAIAMTAGGRYLPAADCLRVAKGLGAHETLMKPFRHRELLSALERILGTEVTARQSTSANESAAFPVSA
jgi:CheY-like chemotaxis protein